MIVAYSLLNFVIQVVIQPKFTGESVSVIPTVSFLSLLFWAWIIGPLGTILALPATLLLKAIMIDADPQSRWINSIVSSDLKGMEARLASARRRTAREGLDQDPDPAAGGVPAAEGPDAGRTGGRAGAAEQGVEASEDA